LSAAIALRQAGIDAHVYEKAERLQEVGAAIALWPNATLVLKRLGVLESLARKSAPILESEIRTWRGRPIKKWTIPVLETPALFTHRADLQAILLEAVPHSVLHTGKSCVALDEREDRVTARFSSGETVQADGVVGADGLHSSIRALLHGADRPGYRGYTMWRSVVPFAHPALRHGLKIEWWGPGRRFGIALNGLGRMNWYAAANVSQPPKEQTGNLREDLLKMFSGWAGPVCEVIGATEESAILQNAILDRPPLAQWGRKAVTLLGDAAHPTSPNLGQGAGMAIEDALCLAQCVRGATRLPDAFRRYEALRKKRANGTTKGSGLVGNMAQWSHPLLVAARTAFLRTFPVRLWERQLKKMYSYKLEIS